MTIDQGLIDTALLGAYIESKCEKSGHNLDSVADNKDISTIELAQLILNDPMDKMMNELKGVLANND
ncbi:hypothetical protein [Lactobacillus delbrueckii]|uniref:hypothetical protein n=1 Tax=Lactobacillus delbrueckii TaxID=1584 RepID=UPI001E596E0A|nr:hypothetical protein [Lactobacillus delbrueckii]MCD5566132.1 hypothetical protein [Lactobacillus delbrueckii subsp. lactis]